MICLLQKRYYKRNIQVDVYTFNTNDNQGNIINKLKGNIIGQLLNITYMYMSKKI